MIEAWSFCPLDQGRRILAAHLPRQEVPDLKPCVGFDGFGPSVWKNRFGFLRVAKSSLEIFQMRFEFERSCFFRFELAELSGPQRNQNTKRHLGILFDRSAVNELLHNVFHSPFEGLHSHRKCPK